MFSKNASILNCSPDAFCGLVLAANTRFDIIIRTLLTSYFCYVFVIRDIYGTKFEFIRVIIIIV